MQLLLVAMLASLTWVVSAPGSPDANPADAPVAELSSAELSSAELSSAELSTADLSAQEPAALEWSEHYANAKQQAEKQHRPLLVVVEDKSSPGGQLELEKLASGPEQVDLLKQYELCRMDVNTPYGKRVAAAFGANKFPMTVITDKSAKFVTFRADGSIQADAWKQALASRLMESGSQPSTIFDAGQPQRIDASKIITPWPTIQSQPPSNCPNCIRSQQRFYYQ